jgi:threonine/homoserine/homoserine lactone efflux protein
MKEILDILVWVGFAYILFIFLRGMNETQVEKHRKKLEEAEQKNQDKKNKEEEKI